MEEAEAFAAGLPAVAGRLHKADPEAYPEAVWADWLSGEHRPGHRRRVLAEFADGVATDGTVVEKGFLGSVKVLGEGVDTKNCDSVFWADVRGSMPDLVQAVGRALRMTPGEGKVARLVVPVLLGPGETADTMLTSRAYGGLAKLLEALRAHDARVVEQLAEQQAPSASTGLQGAARGQAGGGGVGGPAAPARALLKFSTPRDPAQLAAFINLRVLDPEHEHWRRGIEAAVIFAREHGDLIVPFTFRVPTGEEAEELGWPAALANYPLGQWVADNRRFHARGDLGEARIAQLAKLGMVWSHYDVTWEEGLAAARGWAEANGHLLAPTEATHQGYRVGIWLKNARAAARKATENERRRAEGLPVESSTGVLAEARREQLDDIDPSWCPAWAIEWQRAFHLTRHHLEDGGELPTGPGEVVRQGEDLGRWIRAQRLGWDRLTGVQQWMCGQVLGIEPAAEEDKPAPRRTQADKWAVNFAAARQFFEREGHLRVPRKHVERLVVGQDQEERELRLGAWIGNQRSWAATLTPERMEQLSAIGMRWA